MNEPLQAFLAEHLALPLSWTGAVAVAVAVVIVLEFLNRQLFLGLQRLVVRTETKLDDLLLKQMRWPAQALVFLAAIHVLFTLRGGESETSSKAVTIVELLLIAYIVIEALEMAVIHYWLGERKKVLVPNVVRHLILVVIYSVAALSIVTAVTGVNVVPLLATSTVITVVLGLALQDTLGNLFAGLALSLEQPFREGDWIYIDGIEGRIEHMGWRATHLRTFTRDVLVFPNSVLSKAKVQNFDRPEKLTGRNVEVPVALHAPPAEVEAALQAAVAKTASLLAEPASKAWFVATTPLYHRYVMRIWVSDFATHDDAESDFMKALFLELRARGLALVEGKAGAGVDGQGGGVVATPPR
ncbi:MAG: mechanosensitive ion channel family protein [Deltaproteobacteria bacterium]|nr:mechanosensitive ion channel family protein [Deltaproteobacteria bacterium]